MNDFNAATIEAFEEIDAIKSGEIESKSYSSSDELFNDLGL